jgi:geranylgeranyl pyrophosphate synthase
MVAGQYFDITATPEINLEALTLLHRKKTGALILASVRMGALCGGATPAQLAQLSQYGEAVGLAFQLQDDVLDADQDTKAEGPPSFVKLLGLEGTQQRAQVELQTALQAIQGLPQPQILDALARFTVERSG